MSTIPKLKRAVLRQFQLSAVEKADFSKHNAFYIPADVGLGKTYMACEIIERFIKWIRTQDPIFNFCPVPVLVLTPVDESFRRVAELMFNLTNKDVKILTYSELLSGKGFSMFKFQATKKTEDEDRDARKPIRQTEWHNFISPRLVILDEAHRVKKQSSRAYKNLLALLNVEPKVKWLFLSATPAEKIDDLQLFGWAIGKYKPSEISWNNFLRRESGSYAGDVSQWALKNFKATFRDNFIYIPPIRTKYKSKERLLLCGFASEEDQVKHEKAWAEYLKIKEETQGLKGSYGQMLEFVARNKYRESSDLLKVNTLFPHIKRDINEGFSVVVGVNFQHTLAKLVNKLVTEGVCKREEISIIWGGGDLFTKQIAWTKEEIIDLFGRAAKGELKPGEEAKIKKILKFVEQKLKGIDDLIVGLDGEDLKLGKQSRDERWIELDKFQSGQAKVLIFTLSAGGTGISAHHTDEYYVMHGAKIEYKDDQPVSIIHNGQECIHLLRPRKSYMFPGWSGMDAIQAFGRPHRLTSLSDTEQCAVYFSGTVETEVAQVQSKKFAGLSISKYDEQFEKALLNPSLLANVVARSKQFIGFELKELNSMDRDEIHETGDTETEEDDEGEENNN